MKYFLDLLQGNQKILLQGLFIKPINFLQICVIYESDVYVVELVKISGMIQGYRLNLSII